MSEGEGEKGRLEGQVIAWLARQGVNAYLVGGWVRDRLLGRRSYDLDVAMEAGGMALARRLADHFGGAYHALDHERDTGRAILHPSEGRPLWVDVARFRGADLAADLADRDFTINALAVAVWAPDEIIDLHNGLRDLEEGLIRPVSEWSIRRDPLRALRAIRQSAQLGFRPAPETEALIRSDGIGLVEVAGERVRDEMARLLALPRAAPYLERMDRLGLLTLVLPELEPLRSLEQSPPHYLPVLAHSLATVDTLEQMLSFLLVDAAPGVEGRPGAPDREPVPAPPIPEVLAPFAGRLEEHLAMPLGSDRPRLVTLKLAALLHDAGKAVARSVDESGRIRAFGHDREGAGIARAALHRLRFNRAEERLAETIVRHHMRPLLLADQGHVSERAVYRFFRDTGEAGPDVLLHALADRGAVYGLPARDEPWLRLVSLAARMFADYWQRPRERVSPPTLVSGHDLMREFGLRPGPHIGELLEAVREAQVAGEVQSVAEALTLVRGVLAEQDMS